MSFLALLLYLVFVFIRPQEYVDSLYGLPLVKFSLISMAMFLFFQSERRYDSPQNRILIYIAFVVLMSGLRNDWVGGGIDASINWVTIVILPFLLIQNLVDTTKKQHIVMLLFIVAAMVMINDGIAQIHSINGVGWSGATLSQGTRITYLGIFSDPNDLGMYLVMVLPIIGYFVYQNKGIYRYLFLAAFCIDLYGIFLTNSRGALLGVLGLAAFGYTLKYGIRKTVFIGAIVSPILLVVMSLFRTISSEEESAAGRIDAWYEGFQMLFWRPFFGVGMGRFTDYHELTAHNSFVLVFAELGLVGYFFWLSFIILSVITLLKVWSSSFAGNVSSLASDTEKKIALTFMFSFVGYLITAFFLSRSYTPVLYIFCALFVATYYRVTRISRDEIVEYEVCPIYKKYIWRIYLSSFVLIYTAMLVLL